MSILLRFTTRFPFFTRATVSSAIADLTRVVDNLDRVVNEESAEIEIRSQRIADLQIANHLSSDQVYRAKAIQRRITDLIA